MMNTYRYILGLLVAIMLVFGRGEVLHADSNYSNVTVASNSVVLEDTLDILAEMLPEVYVTGVLVDNLGNNLDKLGTEYLTGVMVSELARFALNVYALKVKNNNVTQEEIENKFKYCVADMARVWSEHIGWVHAAATLGPDGEIIYRANNEFSLRGSFYHYVLWYTVFELINNNDIEMLNPIFKSVEDGDFVTFIGEARELIEKSVKTGLKATGYFAKEAFVAKGIHEIYDELLKSDKYQNIMTPFPWREILMSTHYWKYLLSGVAIQTNVIPEIQYQLGWEEGADNFCDRHMTSLKLKNYVASLVAKTLIGIGFKGGLHDQGNSKFSMMHRILLPLWFIAYAEIFNVGPVSMIYNMLPDLGDPLNVGCHEAEETVGGWYENFFSQVEGKDEL